MNPVFVILVILAAVLLWFILSFVFIPLGSLLYKMWRNTTDKLNKQEKEREETKD